MLLDWITGYLSDRRFRVRLEEVASDWWPVISGVPQGSVLSPILCAVYVADIPEGIYTRKPQFNKQGEIAGNHRLIN